jgi:colanic acid/amylovoran biosynthesis protein
MSFKFMFMGNGDYRNRGCEAITRGTLEILRSTFSESSFIDSYFLYDTNDKEIAMGNDILTKPVKYPKRWTLQWLLLQITLQFSEKATGNLLFSKQAKEIDQSSAVFSLGGDNYSLDYGVPKRFLAMGNFVKRKNKPFIIFGASIGPFKDALEFEKELITHFNENIDLIFVREEESYSYLCQKGLENKTHLMADPAFMMRPKICTAQEVGFELPEKFIAVNFSKLMATCATNGDVETWKKICNDSMEKIYKKYRLPIILIPHVAQDKEFMEITLSNALRKYSDIKMINSELNAAQMKWVISKAKCLIAARTHATIAGFSSAVPTLSLGYSIKALGLNKLLFGHTEYLLYCKDITADNVVEKVELLLQQESQISTGLQKKQNEMKMKALESGSILLDFMKAKNIS